MSKYIDPITGLEVEETKPEKEFWIVSLDGRYGYAWESSMAKAKRKQLARGCRATTKIIEV